MIAIEDTAGNEELEEKLRFSCKSGVDINCSNNFRYRRHVSVLGELRSEVGVPGRAGSQWRALFFMERFNYIVLSCVLEYFLYAERFVNSE